MDLSKLFSLSRGAQTPRRIKHRLEHALGVKLLRGLPLGNSVFVDVRKVLPDYRGEVLFDVGANVGQTANEFAFWWPDARILSFEPVAQSFAALCENTAHLSNVKCFQLALGAEPGTTQMLLAGQAVSFRIVQEGQSENGQTERVSLDTVDAVASRLSVDSISYLKIDTEGHDLHVLRGAASLLERGAIELVEVEAGMNPENELHVPLEHLKSFLEGFGYLLFGIYEQRHDWPTGRPILRRCNAVFISRELSRRQHRTNG